jgi:hypothetical protein
MFVMSGRIVRLGGSCRMNLAAKSWNLLAWITARSKITDGLPGQGSASERHRLGAPLSAKRMDNPSMVRIRVSMGVLDQVVTFSSSVLVGRSRSVSASR